MKCFLNGTTTENLYSSISRAGEKILAVRSDELVILGTDLRPLGSFSGLDHASWVTGVEKYPLDIDGDGNLGDYEDWDGDATTSAQELFDLALVSTSDGIVVIDVTDAASPQRLDLIANLRGRVKVDRRKRVGYASGGSVIFSLRHLRAGMDREDQDKESASRQVRIALNGKVVPPAIELKRPPVVLVHGLWSDDTTWDTFEALLQGSNKPYVVKRANYSDEPYSNAGSFSQNYPTIKSYLNKAIGVMGMQHFAATKVDIVSHSMGGLLVREHCRQESLAGRACNDQIHKLITIDTPHKGSELADILVVYRQYRSLIDNTFNFTPPFRCHNAIDAFIEGSYSLAGIHVGSFSPHPIDLGAIDDLASGRWTEAPFNTIPSGSWHDLPELSTSLLSHTVVGVATATAHDSEISALWDKVLSHCDFTLERIFGTQANTNDRIVSQDSQTGDLAFPKMNVANGVDHISVLKDASVVKGVKDLLEEFTTSPSFSVGR